MISTMAALVLGLLVASAASSYFAQKDELTQLSAKFVLLDRLLAHYGPEAKPTREMLRSKVAAMIDQMWPQERGSGPPQAPNEGGGEVLYDDIQQLAPQNDIQRSIKNEALGMAVEVGKTRWLMFEQGSLPIPFTFLMVVVFWFTIVFRQLRPPRSTQSDRHLYVVSMRAFRCRRHPVDPGTVQAFRGPDSDLERSRAERSRANGKVNLRFRAE